MIDIKEAIERELASCERQIAVEATEVAKHQAIYDCYRDRMCMLEAFLGCISKESEVEVNNNELR